MNLNMTGAAKRQFSAPRTAVGAPHRSAQDISVSAPLSTVELRRLVATMVD